MRESEHLADGEGAKEAQDRRAGDALPQRKEATERLELVSPMRASRRISISAESCPAGEKAPGGRVHGSERAKIGEVQSRRCDGL